MPLKSFLLLNILILTLLSGCCGPDASRGVYIYSVTATPTHEEQITLKNDSRIEADIFGWTLGDLNHPLDYKIPDGTFMSAWELKTFPQTTLGFQINDSDETIYLKDADGSTVDTWSN